MDEFDAPGVTVAGLLRRCQRIASLRGDGIALAWLHLEATDVTNEFQEASEAKADISGCASDEVDPANRSQ